jgi:hypothetical protein
MEDESEWEWRGKRREEGKESSMEEKEKRREGRRRRRRRHSKKFFFAGPAIASFSSSDPSLPPLRVFDASSEARGEDSIGRSSQRE